MSDKYKPPRKQVRRRSLSPEPSGESSTDDEANMGERKFPFRALRMRARSYDTADEDDSTDSGTTDNEENKVAREAPLVLRAAYMRPWPPELSSDEDDTADSGERSREELEVTPNNNNDVKNEQPPNKKRRLHRKSYTPRRLISPEEEVVPTYAKPCSSGGSKKANSD